MIAEQFNLYEFISKEKDPLYISIEQLEQRESVFLGQYEVYLNDFGLYEVLNDTIHEALNTPEACYDFVLKEQDILGFSD